MTKVLGWALLLVAGVLCLPLAAAFLDGQGSENWILPLDVVAVAVLGGLLGAALPGFVAGSTRRRVVVGAACGVVAAALGVLVFFVLLSGFDGA